MRNAGLDEAQAGIKIAGEIAITSDVQIASSLWQRVKRNQRASLWEWKRRMKKLVETQHSKPRIMASGPITSWQVGGETVETVRDFIFLGSKISADCDCSHEIKRRLLLGRKAVAYLDNITKKQGHYFADQGPSRKCYGLSSNHVWLWPLDCKESWAPKNWCF